MKYTRLVLIGATEKSRLNSPQPEVQNARVVSLSQHPQYYLVDLEK
ncbi:MAG: hypothetical protein ACPL07_03895 [Candidatus Bathyarchaeia archaeon]